MAVDIHYLSDYKAPKPKTEELRSKTGFSFTRFMIPEICGYEGRAIYLDADMLVFTDIAELWNWDIGDEHVLLYAQQPPERGRKAQFSVFVVDCSRAHWNAEELIGELDAGTYDYHALLYEFAHIPNAEKAMVLPFRWNALEYYKHGETSLIHFTDMNRQPWVEPTNPNGHLFYKAARSALAAGALTEAEVIEAVRYNYVHPALPTWLGIENHTSFWRDVTWPAPYFRLLPKKNRIISRLKRIHYLSKPGR